MCLNVVGGRHSFPRFLVKRLLCGGSGQSGYAIRLSVFLWRINNTVASGSGWLNVNIKVHTNARAWGRLQQQQRVAALRFISVQSISWAQSRSIISGPGADSLLEEEAFVSVFAHTPMDRRLLLLLLLPLKVQAQICTRAHAHTHQTQRPSAVELSLMFTSLKNKNKLQKKSKLTFVPASNCSQLRLRQSQRTGDRCYQANFSLAILQLRLGGAAALVVTVTASRQTSAWSWWSQTLFIQQGSRGEGFFPDLVCKLSWGGMSE